LYSNIQRRSANKEPDMLKISTVIVILTLSGGQVESQITNAQGSMAGEVTAESVILQTRLTGGLSTHDVIGAPGIARFDLSTSEKFKDAVHTVWQSAQADYDFIIKTKVGSLQAGTRYFYRSVYGPDTLDVSIGNTGTFRTNDPNGRLPIKLAVVTGMNYNKFHNGHRERPPYSGDDKDLGFPALESIKKMKPTFFVGTGDNVYYDVPREPAAKTRTQLRKKWHEQFVQPRFTALFADVPTYWEKDDHDHRYDDSDRAGDRLPGHDLGVEIFREQVPVVDPEDSAAVTYRTHRISKHLQIWLPEGRDYRSDNLLPDGPEKTIWGSEQMAWFKRTLLESDATFKILISATPMVGPDDDRKSDNHVNPKGFRKEGDAIFAWLNANDFLNRNFYIVCGDRHWQYHSRHPNGFEEFSTGALVDNNARRGAAPGHPESTDPNAEITQIYTYEEPTGGFLMVTVAEEEGEGGAFADFSFYNEKGERLYSVRKEAVK
jgi:alkaline phosphatase/alkaline phosphatase D